MHYYHNTRCTEIINQPALFLTTEASISTYRFQWNHNTNNENFGIFKIYYSSNFERVEKYIKQKFSFVSLVIEKFKRMQKHFNEIKYCHLLWIDLDRGT